MFFKTIKARFYLITGLLIALICIEYFEINSFIDNLRQSSEATRKSIMMDLTIRSLEKSFWQLRFWEKTITMESHPDAEKQFGIAAAALNRKLADFHSAFFADRFSDKTAQINSLIIEYHQAFDKLIQFKTDQSTNTTKIHSNYQVLDSSIHVRNEMGLMKPLHNLNRFMELYLQDRRESAYQAFKIVFSLIQKKLTHFKIKDERLLDHVVNLERFMEIDFVLEEKIRNINKRFDAISVELTNIFDDIAHKSAVFSSETASAREKLYRSLNLRILWVSGVVFILLLLTLGLIAGTIVAPIRRLSELVARIKNGEYDARFSSGIGDEIAELGFAFNEMLDINSHHRNHLEDMIKKRTDELVKSKEKADTANLSKSRFLANMSHEIRTPMNVILGFADILDDKISDEQQKQYVSLIRISGRSLLTIINDILDLSKIEAGKMALEYAPVSPREIFEETAGIFSQKISKNELEFILIIDPDLPERLILDGPRLRQIIINLMENAVKFTESGYIKIEAAARNHGGEADTLDFIFSVADTGIGIAEDQQKVIFDAFEQQGGQDHTKYGGTGLGLTITCRLAEMMNGVITVESEQNRGSKFTVILKNVRKAAVSDASQGKDVIPADLIAFEKAVILVADDIADNRLLLRRYLASYHFEFIEAENGLQAVNTAREFQPALILMDIKMPVMDGREAAEKLKAEDGTKSIPVIAVTASAMKTAEKELRGLCDGYIRKPVAKEDLVSEIRRFLKHSVKKDSRKDAETESAEAGDAGSVILGSDTLKHVPELICLLETEFMPRWKEIDEVLSMDDVEKFAEDVQMTGTDYQLQLLIEYGRRLKKHASSFNIEKVDKITAAFPEVIEQIQRLQTPLT